ncbi:Gfo/Idh/MocA family protein [Paenibacillus cremeus]|uniref:Gfo/Idh/MocA family oxidoreductase n=1 Tax=Paenibacillus cremeus TaxID=2163881 RepID=A0A559K553_9BACL|nr:Gfo/Idh/MocA family oxidoreductase [Paenibacillus cremeus]TVY07236.1 Gfo/Idh/MocA family oxidoreductase [Paenibacillus cremeus]
MYTNKKLRLALIGAGAIAGSHLTAIQELDSLIGAAICDTNADRAKALLASHSMDMPVYTDYKEMIRSVRPDAVAINLPHFLHKEAAIFCAEQGCHMMLEKPMALNVEECNEIMGAADRYGVRLMIGHTQRYLPENRKARDIIQSGELGKLVMVNDVRLVSYFTDTRPQWFFHQHLAGGGIVMNLGSHSIDKIQWLADSRVVKLKAALTHFGLKGDIEGSGHLWLALSNGATATVSLGGYGGVNRNDTEFVFTQGMLRIEQNRGLSISRNGVYEPVPIEDGTHPFVLQYLDLLGSIHEDAPLAVTAEYSRDVIRIVQTVYESHRSGRELEV